MGFASDRQGLVGGARRARAAACYAYDAPPAAERGIPGAGTVHHVAWASHDEDHEAWQRRVTEAGVRATPVIDRFWFRSVYFREPSGVLFELATLGPGFGIDEDPEHLGEALILPPAFEHLRDAGREEADAAAEPAADRRVTELVARRREPAGEPEGALVLLHGRGADEHDLFPLLDLLDPERRLLGVTPGARSGCRRAGAHWYALGGIPTPEPTTFHATAPSSPPSSTPCRCRWSASCSAASRRAR